MPKTPQVLILCFRRAKAQKIARSLDAFELVAVVANDMKDALKHLKEQVFDMIIVESHLGDSSGLTFLIQAHKHLPAMKRVVLKTFPINMEMDTLVNDVAPCAIFSHSINPQKIWDLLSEGASSGKTQSRQNGPTQADASKADAELQRLQTVTKISVAMTHMIENPNLVLPIMPEIAQRVRALMADDNSNFDDIADLVEKEQGIVARILQVANSPIYAGRERSRNIQQAVGRLGLRETYNILQAIMAQNLFDAKIKGLDKIMKNLWLHSLSTAYSNEIIAKKLSIAKSQDYFMMGLLHDIGKLLIISLLEEGRKTGAWQESEVTEDVVMSLMAMRHNDLGARLLNIWHYPEVFNDVVRLHDDDVGVESRSEPVIVTYFSNLLTRKIGLSLIPYTTDLLSGRELESALNMSPEIREDIERSLRTTVDGIKRSCFVE